MIPCHLVQEFFLGLIPYHLISAFFGLISYRVFYNTKVFQNILSKSEVRKAVDRVMSGSIC